MAKIMCLVTNLFEDVEFVGTIGIIRRSGLDVDIYSLHGTSAKGKYGTEVIGLKDIHTLDYTKYDCLFIPGGPEYRELESTPLVLECIKYFMENNKFVAAICAIPTLIGHLGLLKGRKYTCFKSMNEDFGGTFIDEYAVRDGNLITGMSAAATIDFGLMIVEAVGGKELADREKEHIYYKG